MKRIPALLVLTAFSVAVVLGLGLSAQPAVAAPVPPSGAVADSIVNPRQVTFASSRVFTQDTRLDAVALARYGLIDFQYTLNGPATSNAFTLTLMHSNDASSWVTGTSLFGTITATTSTSGTTDMTRSHNFGAFSTIYVDVTNSGPVTLTLSGLAR